jgi:hypothetical protein
MCHLFNWDISNREFQGLAGSLPPSATQSDGAGRELGEAHVLETRLSEAVRHGITAAVGPYERNLV